MDYTLFFEKNDQLSFSILGLFVSAPDAIVTLDQIDARHELSTYKINQILLGLNNDLEAIDPSGNTSIKFLNRGVLRGYNINNTVIHEMRLRYLERSILFATFFYNFFESQKVSKTTFMKSHFISKTKFYATLVELNNLLESQGFYQSPSVIDDPEYVIRLHLFEFFYTVYNGIGTPFAEETTPIKNLVVALQDEFKMTLTPVQRNKIEVFLKIWITRLQVKSYLAADALMGIQPSHEQQLGLQNFAVRAQKQFNVDIPTIELQYLYTFLITQLLIDDAAVVFNEQQFPQATQLTDQLMAKLRDSGQMIDLKRLDLAPLRRAIMAIHYRFFTFYVEPTMFISENEFGTFDEAYPLYHQIIQSFIDELKTQPKKPLSACEARNLYFDYMFAFINYIPQSFLNAKVYICVDFSQGPLYSRYITQTLKSLQNANIVIETNLSPRTDIYLSDFHSKYISQVQTIWQNPPTVRDWRELEESITQIKRRKIAEQANQGQFTSQTTEPNSI